MGRLYGVGGGSVCEWVVKVKVEGERFVAFIAVILMPKAL